MWEVLIETLAAWRFAKYLLKDIMIDKYDKLSKSVYSESVKKQKHKVVTFDYLPNKLSLDQT